MTVAEVFRVLDWARSGWSDPAWMDALLLFCFATLAVIVGRGAIDLVRYMHRSRRARAVSR